MKKKIITAWISPHLNKIEFYGLYTYLTNIGVAQDPKRGDPLRVWWDEAENRYHVEGCRNSRLFNNELVLTPPDCWDMLVN